MLEYLAASGIAPLGLAALGIAFSSYLLLWESPPMPQRRISRRVKYEIIPHGDKYRLLKRIWNGRWEDVQSLGNPVDTQDEAAAIARGDAEAENVDPAIVWVE